jgi:hypothetical protein
MVFKQNIIVGKNGLLSGACLPGFLLLIFVFCWYFFLHRYTILIQEQSQMFLYTRSYLLHYLHQPGGIAVWAGAFLTQFFIYPPAGACIYSLVFFALCFEYRKALVRLSVFEKSQSVPYIPALLFLPVVAGAQFDAGTELPVVAALAFFRLLTAVAKYRYAPAMIFGTVILCYILTAGNVALTVVLFLIFCLQHRPKTYLLQIAAALAACLSAPLAFSYIIYPVSSDHAYFLYTPLDRLHTGISVFRDVSWLSVIVLPFAGLIARKINAGRKTVCIADAAIIAAILSIIIITRRPVTECIMEIVYKSEKGKWTEVLSASKKTDTGPFQCFYLNLALQQAGSLPDSMFHYRQIGVSGLFLDMQDYFYCYAAGELYCRLGLINEIRRCSYESMVSRNYYREYDVRNVKRLFECAVAGNDSVLAEKYRYLLNRTLFYKNALPSGGISASFADNVLTENKADVLESILRKNPLHRPAFEYLMAYCMLERDTQKAKECFDAYYAGLKYPSLPVHYAELLVLYKHVNKLDESFLHTYRIPDAVRERFDMIDVLLPHMSTDEKIYQTVERQFKDTYWFYVLFPLVDISHTNENEKKILY